MFYWPTPQNSQEFQSRGCFLQFFTTVQHDMKLKRSTYEVLQILSISLTDKTPLSELFDKTYSNDVKEQLSPPIPGLFD